MSDERSLAGYSGQGTIYAHENDKGTQPDMPASWERLSLRYHVEATHHMLRPEESSSLELNSVRSMLGLARSSLGGVLGRMARKAWYW